MKAVIPLRFKLLAVVTAALSTAAWAQTNVQLHYDLGHDIYGHRLSSRPRITATVESFTPDRWGSTYFFIDADINPKAVRSAYGEVSREFNIGSKGWAAHVEFNGGLSGASGSYDNAYLAGPAWSWLSGCRRKSFSLQVLYKYLCTPSHHGGKPHSVQLTEVWSVTSASGLLRFSGYCDVWYDGGATNHLVLSSEPQLWLNLWCLPSVADDVHLSIGTEWEVTKNLVWDAEGHNNRWYVIPTAALKWTF